MFSIGFPEFLLATLALLIFVGPERLPKVARWCGRMIARGQMMIRDIQRELERNAELQDLKQTGLDIKKDITGAVQEFGKLSDEVTGDVKRLGESLSFDAESENHSGRPKEQSEDEASEQDFADEVELLRRSRRAEKEATKPNTASGSEPVDPEISNG